MKWPRKSWRLSQLPGHYPVTLVRAANRDVILIERFDREKTPNGWTRRSMVSALTIFELDDMMARYASYEDLAEIIRHRFDNPQASLEELFARLTFNILCGNTDDHARNHAAFWDGHRLQLTPAYDLCPQGRTGNEASQAMRILGDRNQSQLTLCLEACEKFNLRKAEALSIVAKQISGIRHYWKEVCDEVELSDADRQLLYQRQFLNPYSLEGIEHHFKAHD
ncbi:type II toxin-antitoxin system HipA family toxin [Hahella ganghwensis]|uniref:type II toxin-antitoxin system HipA family toxin n=1 Tax=Hahella ganghwensis TaxID=286420 RepID=UPI0012F721D2|nr:HipA domain-containing protein [Hahella ganghwensis]